MQINVAFYEDKVKISEKSEKYKSLQAEKIERLKIIQTEVEAELCPVDRTNLIKESNNNISKFQKYITILSDERVALAKMKTMKDHYEGELNDFYRFHWDKSTKMTESSINKYVAAHAIITSLTNLIRVQEAIVEYYVDVVRNFGNRNFTIKNIIEASKLELGLT